MFPSDSLVFFNNFLIEIIIFNFFYFFIFHHSTLKLFKKIVKLKLKRVSLKLRTTIKTHNGFPQMKLETRPLFSSQGDLSLLLFLAFCSCVSHYLEACIGNGILKGLHLEDHKGLINKFLSNEII
jgi:hypothetical protein